MRGREVIDSVVIEERQRLLRKIRFGFLQGEPSPNHYRIADFTPFRIDRPQFVREILRDSMPHVAARCIMYFSLFHTSTLPSVPLPASDNPVTIV